MPGDDPFSPEAIRAAQAKADAFVAGGPPETGGVPLITTNAQRPAQPPQPSPPSGTSPDAWSAPPPPPPAPQQPAFRLTDHPTLAKLLGQGDALPGAPTRGGQPGNMPPVAERKEPAPLERGGVSNPFAKGGGAGAGGAAGPTMNDAKLSLGFGPEWQKERDSQRYWEGTGAQAGERGAERAYAGGVEQAALERGHADQLAREGLVEQQKAATVADWTRQKLAHLDNLVTDAANDKIDPDRIWHGDGGVARHVAAAVGVALGAFGASLGHSPNAALQIVNSAVDRDIDAQKAAHAGKMEEIGHQKNLLTMGRQLGLDEGATRALGRSITTQQMIERAHATATQTNSEATRTLAGQAMDFWRGAKAKDDAAVAQAIEAQHWAQLHPHVAAGAGAGAANVAAVQEKNAAADTDAGDLLSQGSDIAGYGYGGRIAHQLAQWTGLPLESNAARRNHMTVEEIAAAQVKASGGRPTPEAIDRRLANVHDEEDVRNLARRNQSQHRREEDAAAAKGGKRALGNAKPEDLDEDER